MLSRESGKNASVGAMAGGEQDKRAKPRLRHVASESAYRLQDGGDEGTRFHKFHSE